MDRISHSRRFVRTVAVLATSAVLASCSLLGGDDDGGGDVTAASMLGDPVESGLDTEQEPVRGGQLVYGLEAEAAKGYCLMESELSISGMQVARALYDTLTIPDAKGGYAPYLAKAVTPAEDYKSWTISLRDGVTFHDGSALDARIVKMNLDGYRGKLESRSPLLFSFVFANIDEVTVVNELTVKVTTKVPWVAFPAALYGSGRIGMMGEKQILADADTCASQPIGTGPFSFVSWTKGTSLRTQRNANYWQIAPDGEPYPYLNAVEFRPMPNSDERIAALQSGEINMLHTSTTSDMAGTLTELRDAGEINLLLSDYRTEVSYLMFNSSKKPLDQRAIRVAIAQAIDREKLNAEHNRSLAQIADGPFAPGVPGHLDDPGFPEVDVDAARKAVATLAEAGGDTELGLLTSDGPVAVRQAQMVADMLEEIGFTIKVDVENEADLIGRAISGEYDIITFRNQPGEDPDMDHIWWYGEANPVNFGRFQDDVIDANLDEGRSNPDPDARRAAYEEINRQFAKEVWNVWLWYAPWAVAESPNVHDILGPDLPGTGGPPPPRLVTGHSLLGIWIESD